MCSSRQVFTVGKQKASLITNYHQLYRDIEGTGRVHFITVLICHYAVISFMKVLQNIQPTFKKFPSESGRLLGQ